MLHKGTYIAHTELQDKFHLYPAFILFEHYIVQLRLTARAVLKHNTFFTWALIFAPTINKLGNAPSKPDHKHILKIVIIKRLL